MSSCPIARITRILDGATEAFDAHERECGDRVVGVALHPDDHAELSIAELWGLPVLAWDVIPKGTFRLLCEALGVLIPQLDTFEELLDHWTYQLERPADDSLAA